MTGTDLSTREVHGNTYVVHFNHAHDYIVLLFNERLVVFNEVVLPLKSVSVSYFYLFQFNAVTLFNIFLSSLSSIIII